MKINSTAFQDGDFMPRKYAYDDLDISPPLEWSGAPDGTKTFALICDDPDAPMGTWVHWVIYNLPGNTNKLPENIPHVGALGNGAAQGRNDFRKTGYDGPCPPGGIHRYYFKLYALDNKLEAVTDLSKEELLKAMEGHVLAEGQLMGRYKRN
jgi:hypothetical protein